MTEPDTSHDEPNAESPNPDANTGSETTTLDDWVDTMSTPDDSGSGESDPSEPSQTSSPTSEETESEDSWKKSLSPDTTADSDSTASDSEDVSEADDDIRGGADTQTAVAEIGEPLETITETGYSINTVATAWLDYLLAMLTGSVEEQKSVVETVTGGNTSGQSTLTAQTKGGEDWVESQFDEAADRLLSHSHRLENDLLTPLFQHLDITDTETLAQNFTPAPIAEFMVQNTVDDAALTELNGAVLERPVLSGDPACGAGIFLIALADRLRSVESPPPTLIMGQDLDSTAAKASAVNMALHGVPGFVIQGDTLIEESNQVWRIGPVAPDPCPTVVAELPAETLPDGFGSYPNGTASFEPAATMEWTGTEPETFGTTDYESVPRSRELFKAFARIDSENGIEPPVNM